MILETKEFSTIGIVGLGLIGGSAAKALSKAGYKVIGWDLSDVACADALACGAIVKRGTSKDFAQVDLLIVALYPATTVEYILSVLPRLRQGTVVVDFSGVKKYVVDRLQEPCKAAGVHFVGGHPMAGREFSGFTYSQTDLYQNASMILTPDPDEDEVVTASLEKLFYRMGFARVVHTTPENHDRMIAFTSQLAHVVSNAYIKSPEATEHRGYSAGSYKDLTRVARLNEVMWTELFLANAPFLSAEIGTLIENLKQYKDAIDAQDADTLRRILKEGSDRKKEIE